MSQDLKLDVIRHIGDNKTLVYRDEIEDFNVKSQLIVDESQEAIFYKDGQALDLFGPGRHPLNSNNVPILKRIFGHLFKGNTPFPCHVYFINKVNVMAQLWGTDKAIPIQDPKFKILTEARAYGQYGIRIEDSRRFLVGIVGQLPEFSTDAIGKYIKAIIVAKAKVEIAKAITTRGISFVEITQYLDTLSSDVEKGINEEIAPLGLVCTKFVIESITIPDEHIALLRQKREEYAAGLAELELEAERTRVMAKARAEARATEGYTYQEEQKFDVLKAAAANEGTAGGMMGMGMGLGMGAAVGGTVGKEAAQAMGQGSAPNKKHCPNCGAEVGPNAKFCPECGTKIPTVKFCSNCGAKLSETAKFCPECGTKVEE